MRRLTSLLLLAATLALTAPAVAQVRAPDGAPNPTASSVNEEMLFKQDPKIHGRISIPNQTAANLIQPQAGNGGRSANPGCRGSGRSSCSA